MTLEGCNADESAALLTFLYRHGARPEFTCRVRWDAPVTIEGVPLQ